MYNLLAVEPQKGGIDMATRQYIGARYVPIIDGDWDITKEYDPLVIVMHQGNSYTSRTFVPANTPITNTTYWACTGNYNAQVEAYRQATIEVGNKLNTYIGDNYINVKEQGCYGDGIHDDTATLQSIIDNADETMRGVFIPEGTYLIDGITINKNINIISDGTLKASQSCNTVVELDVPPIHQDDNFVAFKNMCSMNFKIDGSGYAQTGIKCTHSHHIVLKDTMIYGITTYGVYMNQWNAETIINNLIIEGYGDSCTGIVAGQDTEIDTVIMKDCHTGMVLNYKTRISNYHAWITRNFTGSVMIKHIAGTAMIDNVYADTYQYAFEKDDSSGFLSVSGLFVYENTNFIPENETAYILHAGIMSSFQYSIFDNVRATNCTLIKLENGNMYRVPIGLSNLTASVVMPEKPLNITTSFEITGQTGGTNYVAYNQATGLITISINCVGNFAHNTEINNLLPSIPVEVALPFSCAINDNDVYKCDTGGYLIIDTNGKLKFKFYNHNNVSAIRGYLQFNPRQ